MRVGLLPLVVSFLGNQKKIQASTDAPPTVFSKLKCNEWFYHRVTDNNNASNTQTSAYMVPCIIDTHDNYYSACNNARNVEINNPFIIGSNSASDPIPYCPSNEAEHMNVMSFAHELGTAENYDTKRKDHPFNLAVHRIGAVDGTDAAGGDYWRFDNYYCIDQAGALSDQTTAGKQHIPDFKYFSPKAHTSKTHDVNGQTHDKACVSINYKKHDITEKPNNEYCDTLERNLKDRNWKDSTCGTKHSLICQMDLGEFSSVNKATIREMDTVDQHLQNCDFSPFHKFMHWPLPLRIVIALIAGGFLLYCVGYVLNCCMEEIKIETKEEMLQRELEEQQRRQYIQRPLSRGEAWR